MNLKVEAVEVLSGPLREAGCQGGQGLGFRGFGVLGLLYGLGAYGLWTSPVKCVESVRMFRFLGQDLPLSA